MFNSYCNSFIKCILVLLKNKAVNEIEEEQSITKEI